jgi:hypothetical protein
MFTLTQLAPIGVRRAQELFDQLRSASQEHDMGLALDEQGRVVGLISVDVEEQEHTLGDLDVHA